MLTIDVVKNFPMADRFINHMNLDNTAENSPSPLSKHFL